MRIELKIGMNWVRQFLGKESYKNQSLQECVKIALKFENSLAKILLIKYRSKEERAERAKL